MLDFILAHGRLSSEFSQDVSTMDNTQWSPQFNTNQSLPYVIVGTDSRGSVCWLVIDCDLIIECTNGVRAEAVWRDLMRSKGQ